jgi:hypothetical protein
MCIRDRSILWRTVTAVLRRDGISQDGHATMPEFRADFPDASVESPQD